MTAKAETAKPLVQPQNQDADPHSKVEDTTALSKTAGFPQAEGKQTSTTDFDRNRAGTYGGLPSARGGNDHVDGK